MWTAFIHQCGTDVHWPSLLCIRYSQRYPRTAEALSDRDFRQEVRGVGTQQHCSKPMAALMMQKAYPGDATVTVCHSRSKDLVKECQEADIIIAALGQPNFVKAEMVKEGAVVIDVGTTRVPDASKKSGFKLTGDVKFDEVAPKCSFITPVPGGVGPMTIVSLMKNTLLAGKKAIYQ